MYRNNYQLIFRQRLKEAREKKGLTQSALAEKLGTSDKRIIRWEKPMRHKDGTTDMETLPRLDRCIDLCKALDIDLDYLLGNKDIPNDEIPFISEKTGLSASNIESISHLEKKDIDNLNAFLTPLLNSKAGLLLLSSINDFLNIDFLNYDQSLKYNDNDEPQYINKYTLEELFINERIVGYLKTVKYISDRKQGETNEP